jgi:hypothetical protein
VFSFVAGSCATSSATVSGENRSGKARSRTVRACSIVAVDPLVSTAIDWTGRRCSASAEMVVASQTVRAVADLLSLKSGAIVTAVAPAGQRPSAGVPDSSAHDARPGSGPKRSVGNGSVCTVVTAWTPGIART